VHFFRGFSCIDTISANWNSKASICPSAVNFAATTARWVKMAKFIPWDEFEKAYRESFKNTRLGPPAKSVRVALGALIIKERLGTSDEETVEQIRENPYLQYFLGYKEYDDEKPSDPSLFVYFRKRFGKKSMAKINETIACKALDKEAAKNGSDENGDDDPKGRASGHRGKLLVDATCTPADITFPTDLKLLNTAREKSEEIIDMGGDRPDCNRRAHLRSCRFHL